MTPGTRPVYNNIRSSKAQDIEEFSFSAQAYLYNLLFFGLFIFFFIR